MGTAKWRDRILESTRGRVVSLLRRSERTVSDLAGELGLTDNAVRLHLSALERDGLVEASGTRREWTGKPAVLYRATVEAEGLFPKAYAAVASALLTELEQAQGPGEVERLLQQAGSRLGAAAAREGDAAARVQHAADVLTSLGGLVEVKREDGAYRLQGYSCPMAELVNEHPLACRLAEALVGAVVGSPATECCDRGERPRCAFRVAAA